MVEEALPETVRETVKEVLPQTVKEEIEKVRKKERKEIEKEKIEKIEKEEKQGHSGSPCRREKERFRRLRKKNRLRRMKILWDLLPAPIRGALPSSLTTAATSWDRYGH